MQSSQSQVYRRQHTAALTTMLKNLKPPSWLKNDSCIMPNKLYSEEHVHNCNRTEKCCQSSDRVINFQVNKPWCHTNPESTLKLALRPSPQVLCFRHRSLTVLCFLKDYKVIFKPSANVLKSFWLCFGPWQRRQGKNGKKNKSIFIKSDVTN